MIAHAYHHVFFDTEARRTVAAVSNSKEKIRLASEIRAADAATCLAPKNRLGLSKEQVVEKISLIVGEGFTVPLQAQGILIVKSAEAAVVLGKYSHAVQHFRPRPCKGDPDVFDLQAPCLATYITLVRAGKLHSMRNCEQLFLDSFFCEPFYALLSGSAPDDTLSFVTAFLESYLQVGDAILSILAERDD